MSSLVTTALYCVTTSLTFCFCQATASLFNACCGNDKPSTVPPSATSGRKRSIVVLFLSIGISLAYQWGVAPTLIDTEFEVITGVSYDIPYLLDAWVDGCEEFRDDEDMLKVCAGNNGNYRASFATVLFFTLAAIGAACKPTMNREAWPAKYVLYLFLVAGMAFVPSSPLFSDIYLNIARVGGIFFILFQQIVIVDVAHNWNENWVDKADKAEAEETGSGNKWLAAILASVALMYCIWLGLLIYMFIDFTGCTVNNGFIAMTLVFSIAITTAQLTGEEGSLLTSACVCAWASFLCFNAVSNNPDASCNPRIGELSGTNIALGLIVTLVTSLWTGWSYTAEDKLNLRASPEDAGDAEEKKDGGKQKVTGIVTGSSGYGADEETPQTGYKADENDDEGEPNGADPKKFSNSWALNVALIFVVCWKSMVLTQWGGIVYNGTVANPSSGRISMWMIIASQWVAMTLYLWTLMAPRLFPDRDFS